MNLLTNEVFAKIKSDHAAYFEFVKEAENSKVQSKKA